jgi:hypothetical protein
MEQEFNKISENYRSSAQFSHCISYIKNLPFKDVGDLRIAALKNNSKNILLPFLSIKIDLTKELFDTIGSQIPEEINSRYQSLERMNIIKSMRNSFTQLRVLAGESDVSSDDLLIAINKLEKKNDDLLEPLKKTIDYSADLILLARYLDKSKSLPTYSNYKNMLNDLNEEYQDTLQERFHDILDNITAESFNLLNSFRTILDELLDRIHEKNPEALSTMSTQYSKELNNSNGDISQFLLDKTFNETITASIKLEENQKIQAYIVFEDNSIAVKKKGVFSPVNTSTELDDSYADLKESIISYKLKKRPKIAKIFIEIAKESVNFSSALAAIDTFVQNEQILKNMKMDPNIFVNNSFEVIDDHMNSLISEHKNYQYATSILSSKNKHLLTPECMKSFKVLKEMNITEQELQNVIGKKLAAIKTPDDLESYLTRVIAQYTGFTHEVVSDKLVRANIKPVYDQEDVLVFPVTQYQDSKNLGSPSWCIVRDSSYFETYTDYNKKQYFLYDFSKNEKDNDSLIGFTLTHEGEFHTQHLRDDDYVSVNDKLQSIANHIMFHNQDDFKLSKEKIMELDKIFKPSIKKQNNKNKQGL